MSDHITDFISAAVSDKPVQAIKAFSAAIEPKLDAVLSQKREEIAQRIFNSSSEENE
jgi:hypothetical protein